MFAIIRLYLKRKQREREMEEMQQMLAMDEAADMVGAEAELSPEERRRQEQRQAIEQMAKSAPGRYRTNAQSMVDRRVKGRREGIIYVWSKRVNAEAKSGHSVNFFGSRSVFPGFSAFKGRRN